MSHWTIDLRLECRNESLNNWSKTWMQKWFTAPLIQVWDAVMSHWTIDPRLECRNDSLNHWSKSGMLWWVTHFHWSIDPSLECCNESLNHWSKSGTGMLWWVTEPLIQVWDAVMSHWTIDHICLYCFHNAFKFYFIIFSLFFISPPTIAF